MSGVKRIAATCFCQLGRRSNQEDALWPVQPGSSDRIFVVCDGVGGSDGGELASAGVCRLLPSVLKPSVASGRFVSDHQLRRAVHDVQSTLDNEEIGDAATTMTLLYLHDEGATVAHIGDSRVYQFRPGSGRVFRTHDHSLVQEFVDDGLLTEEQARTHPHSNVITKAMRSLKTSVEESVPEIDHVRDVRAGDVFLLCTDGVWGEMPAEELEAIMCGEGSIETRMQRLAEATQDSSDNNTAIAVEVQECSVTMPRSWISSVWHSLWR